MSSKRKVDIYIPNNFPSRRRYNGHLFGDIPIPDSTFYRRKRAQPDNSATNLVEEEVQRNNSIPVICGANGEVAEKDHDVEEFVDDFLACTKTSSNHDTAMISTTTIRESPDGDERHDVDTFEDVVAFIRAVRKHQMSRSQQESMLRFFRSRHSMREYFPENLYYLDQLVRPYLVPYVVHHFCTAHQRYIGTEDALDALIHCSHTDCESHPFLKKTNTKGRFLTFPLSEMISRFLESPSGVGMYAEGNSPQIRQEPLCDVQHGALYRGLDLPARCVTLTFHADEGSTFGINGSENGRVLAVSFIINELPTRLRYRTRFLYALCTGSVLPDYQIVLGLFSKEAQALEQQGIRMGNDFISANVPLLVADSIARMAALGHGSFHGDDGCTICYHPGEKSEATEHVRVYPFCVNAVFPVRKKNETVLNAHRAASIGDAVKGVQRASRLLRIASFDPSRGAPPDILHAVGLGHVKSLFKYWTKDAMADLPVFADEADGSHKIIGETLQKRVDTRAHCVKFPSVFDHTILPFTKANKYNGAEFIDFLLYVAFYALDGILPHVLYEILMDLVLAIHLLLQDHSYYHGNIKDHAAEAKALLTRYTAKFQELYGKRRMLYNLHQLSHLPTSLLDWGPVYHTSTFYFEDFLGQLMRAVHGTTDLLSQIARSFQYEELTRVYNKVCKPDGYIRCGRFEYLPMGRPARQINPEFLLACNEFDTENVAVYQRLRRSDNVLLEVSSYGRRTKRTNAVFQLYDCSVVRLLSFVVLHRNREIRAIVDFIPSEPFRALRSTTGQSPQYIRKCFPDRGSLRVLDVDLLFRPAVSVWSKDSKLAFVVFVPNEKYVV